jgi:hypothetical protein
MQPEIGAALVRVEEAHARETAAERELDAARTELVLALREAHERGATFGQLGELVGLSRQRVHELVSGD